MVLSLDFDYSSKLLSIPNELLLYVFAFLAEEDVRTSAVVCKAFRQLCLDDVLWKQLCWRRYRNIHPQTIERTKSWQELFYRKSLYENLRFASNEKKHPSFVIDNELLGITSMTFDNKWLVTAGGAYEEAFELSSLFIDKTVNIYDIKTKELKHKLLGHTDSIYSVQIRGNQILSGSADRKIRLWKVPDNPQAGYHFLRRTFRGHRKTVYSVQMNDKLVVSGSRDCTVKVWSKRSAKCKRTLEGHTRDVLTVQFDNNKAISGSLDRTMRIWDLETGTSIMTIPEKHWISTLKYDDKYIVTGGETKIKVWDVKTGQHIRSFKGHQSLFPPGWITCLQFDENKIISGSFNRTVKIWDINYGTCVNSWKPHTDKISALQYDHEKLVTASRDRTVKFWDFSESPSESEANSIVEAQTRAASGVNDKRCSIM